MDLGGTTGGSGGVTIGGGGGIKLLVRVLLLVLIHAGWRSRCQQRVVRATVGSPTRIDGIGIGIAPPLRGRSGGSRGRSGRR